MRILRFVAVPVLLFLLAASAVDAAERGWKFLGERSVSDAVDHDVLSVTAAEGDLRALQLRVKGRPVQIHSMKVRFANGDVQEVELREVIRAGGSSRVIDLDGGDRVVRSVEFRYDAQALAGHRALVRLFGKR